VYRRPELKPSVKYWLRPDFENRIKAGEIQARFGAEVTEIAPSQVVIRNGDGGMERIPADRVYALTGYHPDFALFEAMGIRLAPETKRPDLNPDTLETNVPGILMAGSVGAGRNIGEVFIENGRYDGEKIFGDLDSRAVAARLYAGSFRPPGE
jgi:thioredoxin reductase (NADPH)